MPVDSHSPEYPNLESRTQRLFLLGDRIVAYQFAEKCNIYSTNFRMKQGGCGYFFLSSLKDSDKTFHDPELLSR